MPRKFIPSNGSEGEGFIERWCDNCARDVTEGCSILMATMVFDIDDPRYPDEWTYDGDTPVCTAFVQAETGEPQTWEPPLPGQLALPFTGVENE